MSDLVPHRLMCDLLAPEQSFLWLHRTVAAQARGGGKPSLVEMDPATAKILGAILGPDAVEDAYAALTAVVAGLRHAMPMIRGRFVSEAEEDLLAVGWAAQTLVDTAGWPRVAPSLYRNPDPCPTPHITFLAYLLAERGMTLPQPMRVVATPGTAFPERPGLAGRPPRERALVQCMRVMVEADRRRTCPSAAAYGFLDRAGMPRDIADGLDALLSLTQGSAPRPVKIHAPHCPKMSRAETDLIVTALGGSVPEHSWLAAFGDRAEAPITRLGAYLHATDPAVLRRV